MKAGFQRRPAVALILILMLSNPLPQDIEILVVDAYRETREISQELLELSGYHANAAKDGAEALARMAKHLVPIVIINEDPPDFSGPSLSACLKAMAQEVWNGANCVTIAVRGDALYRNGSVWSKYDYVLPKPLDYEHFEALLAKVCVDVNSIPKTS